MALTQVKTAGIANDAVTGAKIADDQINSEHYVDGSIDNAHVADDQINSEHYHAGSIDHEHLANDIIDGDNIADNAIDSEHYTDGSIDNEHLADNAVDLAEMAHGTQGDVLYYGSGGAPTRLGAGTSGQFLKTQGGSANPVWADAAGGAPSFRNIVINGACNVAQRGTSGTGSGYLTVDRWTVSKSADEDPTQSQHALTSSDTGPWAKGFRNSFHITNGNNSSNTGGNQAIWYEIEAQDIRNSGWDYTNTSDYLTISYWVKTSVAQTFYGYIVSSDGTSKRHAYSLGSLSANTWTKITKSFPGHADLQFDDNADSGLSISIYMYAPPAQTDSGVSLSAWATHSGSERMPDFATTWWQTNDATFEVTGLQIEATGSSTSATDFEHRPYGEELARCQRYFVKTVDADFCAARGASSTECFATFPTPVEMRANPTITHSGAWRAYQPNNSSSDGSTTPTLVSKSPLGITFNSKGHSSIENNQCIVLMSNNAVTQFSAEL